MSYDGFISYSHSADGRLAPALQKALQSFAKPWYRRRSLNVFRDNTGLSVAPHLWGAITEAMDDSGWFVLLTSPEAAESDWVNKEIEHWKEIHSVDRILPVVTAGEWVWDAAAGDFDWETSTAVPEALRGVFTDEPRHLDLRWAHEETQLNARHGKFRDAVAQLAAPMHGKSKDDLEGEDIRRHRGAVRLAWTTGITIFLLLIAAIVAGIFAKSNADRAEERRKESDSQRLAAQSEQNADRPDLSFLLAAEAYDIDPTLQAEGAILTSLQIDPDLRFFVRGHDDRVTSALVVPDRDLIVTGTASGAIYLTDQNTGDAVLEVTELSEPAGVDIVAFSSDGVDSLVAVDLTGRLLRMDLSTLRDGDVDSEAVVVDVLDLNVGDEVGIHAFTGDANGDRVAAGSNDGRLVVWETTDLSAPAYSVELGEGPVYATAFSPDGLLIATGTGEGSVRVHDTASGEVVWDAPAPDPNTGDAVYTVVFSPDGRTLFAGNANGVLQAWDVESGDQLGPDAGVPGHLGSILDATFTGAAFPEFDDQFLATAGEDGKIQYWDWETLAPLGDPNVVHTGAVNSVFFAPDGSFVTAGDDRVAGYFETETPRLASGESVDVGEKVSQVVLSPDGSTIAVASGPDGNVTLWDVAEREPTSTSVSAGTVVQDVAYDPTGRWIAGALAGGGILMWDTEGDERIIDAHSGDVINVAWSADGSKLLSTAGLSNEATIWSVDDGALTEIATDHEHGFPRGGAFSPDGRYAAWAIGEFGDVVVYDLDAPGDSDDTLRVLEVDDGIVDASREVAFHPTEPLLASAGADSLVHFWDLETFEETGEPLVGHRDAVNEAIFLGEGDRVLTAGDDGAVRLWDLERREPIGGPLVGHSDFVVGVDADGSGLLAVSGSLDGRIIFWDLDPTDWITDGCDVVRRNLTDTERERFEIDAGSGPC